MVCCQVFCEYADIIDEYIGIQTDQHKFSYEYSTVSETWTKTLKIETTPA